MKWRKEGVTKITHCGRYSKLSETVPREEEERTSLFSSDSFLADTWLADGEVAGSLT